MPVTVYPFPVTADPIRDALVNEALAFDPASDLPPKGKLMQTSVDYDESTPFLRRRSGFVDAVLEAYNHHHHLQIRPEDIWLTILTQFGFYVTSHAEELRDKFVAHKGQAELALYLSTLGEGATFDFTKFAMRMGLLLEQEVKDPDLRRWMMPAFTTTTPDDVITASVIMMGTLQKYFRYLCRTSCGIPSITLLGEKADYQEILQRLDKLETFGAEAARFGAQLKPILRRMVTTFEKPTEHYTTRFWRQILDVDAGSGFKNYTGWITAFCFWNHEGKCLYSTKPKKGKAGLRVDGVALHTIKADDVPSGTIAVPVTVHNGRREFEAQMVAGLIGMSLSSGTMDDVLDTVQPTAGWWMYEKD